MAVVVFSKPVPFAVGLLRQLLTRYLPLYKWQIGEEDKGQADEMGRFRDHDIVTGRSSATIIFTELRAQERQLDAPAPAHGWHLLVGQPTTELKPVSDRILLLTCLAAMSLDGHGARVQFKPGGNWLDGEAMKRLTKLVLAGEPLELAEDIGLPADRIAGGVAPAVAAPAQGAAPTLRENGPDVMSRMLPPLVLMLDRALVPDWNQIEEFARALDAAGDWKHVAVPDGTHMLCGRGTRIIVTDKPEPVPDYVYEDAYERSFWYRGDRAAVARHRRHATIGTALDTAAADWETTRQVAKVITLVAGLLARLPASFAVHNLGTGTIFEPQDVGDFLSILARDQLPVQLWIYSCWHSLEDGNVSVSTSGLEPFLGHELEAWNAPLTAEQVRDTTSDLIIYLLDKGPVIGHGDSAGRKVGDKAVRCFRGPSRIERPRPTQSLLLEFRDEGAAEPRPDPVLAPAGAHSAEPSAAAVRIMDDALGSLMDGASPEMRRIVGDMIDGRVGVSASGRPPVAAASTANAPVQAPPLGAPTAPGMPLRRAGGFGRKGL